ncbi:ArnT family glycosyltransferase [Fodinicola acaciae]|uniref:ArnT family glycosyltransferase n=1 Tax=Fodinicola acaciae TaxID=2681555 RepID=UPI0013D6B581|nr:phospholipid carrier-dependent glycosyltransferase [Fodinicola acaciae]
MIGLFLIAVVAVEAAAVARLHGWRGAAAVVRLSVLMAAVVFVGTALLSWPRLLGTPAMSLAWLAAAVGLAGYLAWRRQFSRPRELPARLRGWYARLTFAERFGGGFLLLLLLAELVSALIRWPTGIDALAYHLPRIEHWRVDHSIAPYPAGIVRQVLLAPGAEYLMLAVRLLADSPRYAALVTWLATAGTAVVLHRVAGQLGCGRAGRMVAAVVGSTVPMLVVQASSTLNDPVLAFFLLCFVSLVLELRNGGGGWRLAAMTGLALGAAVVTKTTAFPILLGFGLWWSWLLVRRGWRGIAAGALAGTLVVAILAPFMAMTAAVFGSPLGSGRYVTEAVMREHDPLNIAVNVAKFAATEMVTSNASQQNAVCRGVDFMAKTTGVPLDNPKTAFFGDDFSCDYGLTEMVAPSPVQFTMVAAAVVALVCFGLAAQRAYALAVLVSGLAIGAALAYQSWITRLLMPALVLAAPLAPVAVSRLAAMWPWVRENRAAIGGAMVVCAVLAGTEAVVFGAPRPLMDAPGLMSGPMSTPAGQMIYNAPAVRDAIEQLRATKPKTVGLVQYENSPEFAIWQLLGATEDKVRIVNVRSAVPGLRADASDVDAVLCVAGRDPAECGDVFPAGWRKTVYSTPKSAVVAVVALPYGPRASSS